MSGLASNTFQIRDHLALSSFAALRISRRTEILRCAQDDTPASASFDSQNVLFEMYWALPPSPNEWEGASAPGRFEGPTVSPLELASPKLPFHTQSNPYVKCRISVRFGAKCFPT